MQNHQEEGEVEIKASLGVLSLTTTVVPVISVAMVFYTTITAAYRSA